MSKLCPKCNNVIGSSDRFCEHCGYEFKDITQKQQTSPYAKASCHCPNCNSEISNKAVICPNCGIRVKPPFYKTLWFWVIVVMVVLFFAMLPQVIRYNFYVYYL